MEEESTGKMVIMTGNYKLMDDVSTGGMAIPPGITSSWTTNPPTKERDSPGNHWHMDADSGRQDKNARKIL
jgi:hypothetical protein